LALKIRFVTIVVSKVPRGLLELNNKEEQDGEIHFHYSHSTNSYYAGNIKEYKADATL
jgi:hypothetical protein